MVAAAELMPVIRNVLDEIEDRRTAGAGIRAMNTRAGEFAYADQMRLAGAAAIPEARHMIHEALTGYWARRKLYAAQIAVQVPAELVIGAGYTAAVFCAARVRAGFPKPLVVDRADAAHIGGVFAMTEQPAFWLNSEDRPGLNGYPADGDALNVIPGGLLQPSQVPGREFHDNAVLGWLIRLTLAQYARVVPGVTVTGWTAEPTPRVILDDADFPVYAAKRIIDARGFGDPAGDGDGERILTFPQLMAQADTSWPCRGMTRVAVIGGGKSGLCAAEMILRIGPQAGMRTMALDGAPKVDLYAPVLPQYNRDWVKQSDGRYRRLGSFLPSRRDLRAYHDLTVYNEQAEAARMGDAVLVAGRQYSHAVVCTGWERPDLGGNDAFNSTPVRTGTTFIGRQHGPALYVAGVAADIPFQSADYEQGIAEKPENKVAMWRLGGRTAQLAATLPSP